MFQWKITVIKSIDKIRFTDNDVVHMIRTGIFGTVGTSNAVHTRDYHDDAAVTAVMG